MYICFFIVMLFLYRSVCIKVFNCVVELHLTKCLCIAVAMIKLMFLFNALHPF